MRDIAAGFTRTVRRYLGHPHLPYMPESMRCLKRVFEHLAENLNCEYAMMAFIITPGSFGDHSSGSTNATDFGITVNIPTDELQYGSHRILNPMPT